MSFIQSRNGHYYVEAHIRGQPIRFLVDTGASDIILTLDAARRIGITPEPRQFTKTYHTANGTVLGAPIRLPHFQVGSFVLRNVPASVNNAPMDISLLGMAFFNKLSSYRVENDTLTIHWQGVDQP